MFTLCALGICLSCAAGCQPVKINTIDQQLRASNNRDWSPQYTQLARADFEGDRVTIHNIRNNHYLTEKDFVINYYDRTIDLNDVRSVDFIVVPFNDSDSLAHTMLSFALADGTYIVASVEVRTEKGESYSPWLGLNRQFELTYIVADELDVIRLRTRHREASVYVYPTIAQPQQARELLVDILLRANKLAEKPEFYDTVRNNCTTNLVRHVNKLYPKRVPFAMPILLSGRSDRYAYELGLLDNQIDFERLKAAAYVSDLAEQYHDNPQFSNLIRSRHRSLERLVSSKQTRTASRSQSQAGSAKNTADSRSADLDDFDPDDPTLSIED